MDLRGLIGKLTDDIDASTLLTAFSSAFTLTPSSSPLFPLFTLPCLFHQSSSAAFYDVPVGDEAAFRGHLLSKAIAMALGSTTGSLITTWGLLPSPIETVGTQAIASICVALFIVLIVRVHAVLEKVLNGQKDWASSPLFGLIWATLWLVWTKISPLGRRGVPAADNLEIYRRVLPYIGPTGLDFLIGMAGHTVSNTFEAFQAKSTAEAFRLRRLRSSSPSYGSTGTTSPSFSSDPESQSETGQSSCSGIPLQSPEPRRSSSKRRPSTIYSSTQDEEIEQRWKGPRKLLGGLTGLLGILTVLPAPTPLKLEAPVSEITPLSVGCAIPSHPHPTLNETILTLRQFGSRAQLILLPETTFVAKYAGDKENALEVLQRDVCEQYGVYVMASMDTQGPRGKATNEVVLVGPHGVVGSYAKMSLFPIVESHRFAAGKKWPPTWTLDIAHPHGVTKPEWSSVAPFVRPVPFSPLICLDALHPSLISSQSPPSFLVIPAASQSALATEVIRHAEVLSSTHGIPSIVCSRSASAAIDETGEVKHRQDGGKGFIVTMAIPWLGDGAERELTWAEVLGPVGVLAALGVVSIVAKAGEVWRNEGGQALLEGVETGLKNARQGGSKVRGLLMWRGESEASGATPEARPLLDQDEDSGRAPGIASLHPKKRVPDLMSAA